MVLYISLKHSRVSAQSVIIWEHTGITYINCISNYYCTTRLTDIHILSTHIPLVSLSFNLFSLQIAYVPKAFANSFFFKLPSKYIMSCHEPA